MPATRALHTYYSSNATPGPHSLDALAERLDVQAPTKRHRDILLIKAHTALKDAGFLASFEIVEDAIRVEFVPGFAPQQAAGKRHPQKPHLWQAGRP
jgi:hypothetical protein